MTKPDVEYYAARLSAELAAAASANDPHARRAHEELAKEYRRLLAQARGIDPEDTAQAAE